MAAAAVVLSSDPGGCAAPRTKSGDARSRHATATTCGHGHLSRSAIARHIAPAHGGTPKVAGTARARARCWVGFVATRSPNGRGPVARIGPSALGPSPPPGASQAFDAAVVGGCAQVPVAGRGDPQQYAWPDLDESPPWLLFELVVVSAEHREVADRGRSATVEWNGMVQIRLGGRAPTGREDASGVSLCHPAAQRGGRSVGPAPVAVEMASGAFLDGQAA